VDEVADEALAQRARSGDQAALRTLYERHESALRRRVGASAAADLRRRFGASDVIQDAWITAFLRLEGFEDRGPGSFRAWLTAILDHKVSDQVRHHLRTEKRSVRREIPAREEEPPGSAVPDSHSSPSHHARRSEHLERVLEAMGALSELDREVLKLVHLRGLTFVQAGECLGRSANTTLKLYGRALARLSARLEEPEGR
jgi:RNA polymerase sigma-70 factor (ECF subfamily)